MVFLRLWTFPCYRVFDEMNFHQLNKLLGGEDDHSDQNMERSGVCIRGFASGTHFVGTRNHGLNCWLLFWCNGYNLRRSHCFFGLHCFHGHCTCVLCHARTITHLMHLSIDISFDTLFRFVLIFTLVIATLCYAIAFPICCEIVRRKSVAFYLFQAWKSWSTLHLDCSTLRIVAAGHVFAALC